jgi:hypothetical protein
MTTTPTEEGKEEDPRRCTECIVADAGLVVEDRGELCGIVFESHICGFTMAIEIEMVCEGRVRGRHGEIVQKDEKERNMCGEGEGSAQKERFPFYREEERIEVRKTHTAVSGPR